MEKLEYKSILLSFDGKKEILRFYLNYRRQFIDNETQSSYAKDLGVSLTVYSAIETGSRGVYDSEFNAFLIRRNLSFTQSNELIESVYHKLIDIIDEFMKTLGDIDERSILQISSDDLRDGLTFPLWLIGRLLYCAYISNDYVALNNYLDIINFWNFDLTLKRFIYLVCQLKSIPESNDKHDSMLDSAPFGTVMPLRTFTGIDSLFFVYKALNKPYELKLEDYYFAESNIMMLHRFQLDKVSAICECYVTYVLGAWLDSKYSYDVFGAASSNVKNTLFHNSVFVPVALKYAFLSGNYEYIDKVPRNASSTLLKYAYFRVTNDSRVKDFIRQLIHGDNKFVQAIEKWNRSYLLGYSVEVVKKIPDRLNQRVFLKFMKIMCDRHEDVELWNHLWIEAAPLIYQELGDKFD